MSARKRRAVDGTSRTQISPSALEPVMRTWSIHPHDGGILATLHSVPAHNFRARSDEFHCCDSAISSASYIAISDSSTTISLDVHPCALPSSKVLGLRPVKCAHALSQQFASANPLCVVTASDLKQEIIVSVLQPLGEHGCSPLPLLPLLSLSLPNPSALSCSIADGPTVVLWSSSSAGADCACVCIQWRGQQWVMRDASLSLDSESACCFAHCLGPSSDAATFVFSDAKACTTCIIPALLTASSHPESHVAAATQAIAAALHPVLPMSSSPCMTARILMKNGNTGSDESATPSLLLSRASYCRFMSLQPRGFRSSCVIFTLRIVLSHNMILCCSACVPPHKPNQPHLFYRSTLHPATSPRILRSLSLMSSLLISAPNQGLTGRRLVSALLPSTARAAVLASQS